ncbi:MAG: 6-phosphofructokinase [Planctomycetota bacterium]|nr:6-phosphofructokinase [Planctomycetota bacterium]
MAAKLQGNACIGQSGGPTVVINQSLVGAVEEARKHTPIKKILGAVHGTLGILAETFLDLTRTGRKTLDAVADSPSAALGSCRHEPDEADSAAILEVLRRHNVRYYFYIGGDDSAKSTDMIAGMARRQDYQMRCVHIPKTIDNDLVCSHHTPGFGSAARFVASAVRGDDLDNRSIPGVKVDVIMGRYTGWLTAASILARREKGDGPHLVYLPEVPFAITRFLKDVRRVVMAHGRAVIAVSEGICDTHRKRWTEKLAGASDADVAGDAFGHFQLSGTGALADYLTMRIKDGLSSLNVTRVRGDTFGYLQRSFPGFASPVDQREAREVGRAAVRYACRGEDGSVAIKRKKTKKYASYTELVPLKRVAGKNRKVPRKFIATAGNDIRPAFVDYCLPLTGGIPETETLV